jgi:hypothetical protein
MLQDYYAKYFGNSTVDSINSVDPCTLARAVFQSVQILLLLHEIVVL